MSYSSASGSGGVAIWDIAPRRWRRAGGDPPRQGRVAAPRGWLPRSRRRRARSFCRRTAAMDARRSKLTAVWGMRSQRSGRAANSRARTAAVAATACPRQHRQVPLVSRRRIRASRGRRARERSALGSRRTATARTVHGDVSRDLNEHDLPKASPAASRAAAPRIASRRWALFSALRPRWKVGTSTRSSQATCDRCSRSHGPRPQGRLRRTIVR